jgi:hypothetical protein
MRRYLKLHVTLATNIKVSRLTDRSFRCYIMSLVAAKNQSPEGEWIDEASYRYAVGDLADELPALIAERLLIPMADGSLKVRQWRHWQRADRQLPAAIMPEDVLAKRRKADRERQRRYRSEHPDKRRDRGHDLVTPVTRDPRTNGHDLVTHNTHISVSTPSVTNDHASALVVAPTTLDGSVAPPSCPRCDGAFDFSAEGSTTFLRGTGVLHRRCLTTLEAVQR